MKLTWKKNSCHLELEHGETLLITAKNDKAHFLQVTVDEHDDLCFAKRQNLKGKSKGDKP
jgi:hypothetical protein